MDRPFAVGIVGSRRRSSYVDRKIVLRLLERLRAQHENLLVVSGGASGPDTFAREAAALFDPPLEVLEFPIDRSGIDWIERGTAYAEFTRRAYARNRLIAEKSDEVYALVAEDRTGGTENTVGHALGLGKRVFLVLTDGTVYLSKDGAVPTCTPEASLLDSSFTG